MNVASMVRPSTASRGVERKSAGRSDYMNVCLVKVTGKNKRNAQLIDAGIYQDPPVRNPMQSFTKELQLKYAGIIMMSKLLPYI